MNGSSPLITIGGLTFNIANCLSTLIAAILVFILFFALSRKIEMRPGKAQNLLEWIVDFTNGIVKQMIPDKGQAQPIMFYVFVMFAFIFVSNQLGLILEIAVGGQTFVKSPTSSPIVTMALGTISMVLSHFYCVQQLGFKGYIHHYAEPIWFLTPINILEEFTNFLTLSLRLYGNIFAGEVLLDLIVKMAGSHGILTWIPSLLVSMIWQGFSVFIGAIQAYVFVTLSTVYISHKIVAE
ncbi:MAG: F0F1 ATP synthase subunit A [Lactobacillus sp.]|uniref:ATP synthase subunit a n=1 Tax=Bombilactobacillus bombi TaxID=1303590 RepID=A0A347SRM8_9LACO|nr:F0F1 ATP synthase subunit A [Bombilactobacillus bombi]AXX64687.1 F0F1 ATP synthase subunit A [Bombilactobacillus bombi]MCO6542742.1 F0F1 ATP synthase subunit A [Lactobacillus sp.]RHW46842.1 F0F1 ATP synthase subunit A [Bombilactobacillus bombi]RHW50008.1 F0F1 ATP synthase subunit A [Bombilactobacillus bombi]